MHQETKQEGQMRVLFGTGSRLIGMGIKPPHTWDKLLGYTAEVGGQKYYLSQAMSHGNFNYRDYRWEPRVTLNVQFTPLPEDNLRLIPGEEPTLPTFTIYHEAGKYHGSLRFDRKAVERVHWWSRLWDNIDLPSDLQTVTDYVGLNRGANKILGNLYKRLAVDPTSVTPFSMFEPVDARK